MSEYILNEYFILKLIFSYLPSRDLHNASKVCRNWKFIASRALRENQEPQCCVLDDNAVQPPFNEKLSPTIILDWSTKCHNTRDKRLKVYRNIIQQLHETYNLEDASVYNIVSDTYFFSWETPMGPNIGSLCLGSLDHIHSLMLFGNMPGVNIECFQGSKNRIMKPDGSITNPEEISKSKGIFLTVGAKKSCTDQAQIFIDQMLEIYKLQPNSEMILAGGITDAVRKVERPVQNVDFLLVSFGGDNTTVLGDIHDPETGVPLDQFMENLSNRAGKTPEDSIRLVFAFLCINRLGAFRDINLYKKYFAGVPIYGFYSYGEYYFQNTQDKAGSPSEDGNCFYRNSSSFVIVTLKKSKTHLS